MLPRDPFTTADAIAAGYSQQKLRGLVTTGTWVPLRRGVYCTADRLQASRWSPRSRHILEIEAAQLVVPRATVASGWSAALVHGLPMPVELDGRVPTEVTLTTGAGRGRRLAGIRLLGAPLAADHVTCDFEVVATTPARTAVDLAAMYGADSADALAVVDAVLHRGLLTPAELRRVAGELHRRPGCRRARRLIERADARAESPLESHSRMFFLLAGIPMPESQVQIRDDQGFVGRVDFLWRQRHTIGEADGRGKYLDPDVLYREKRREDRLREMGFQVVRWDFSDLRHAPRATAARIQSAFQRSSR